jgi:hypothetical protein
MEVRRQAEEVIARANNQLPCQTPFQPLISGASYHLFYREQFSPRQINAARPWPLTCWEMQPKIHVGLLCHQTSPDTSANLELQHLTGEVHFNLRLVDTGTYHRDRSQAAAF